MSFVIMAGGSGTRFWPLSRRSKPKQLLCIAGKDPMIVATYERIRPLASHDSEVLVIAARDHGDETRELFKNTEVRIVVEPLGRNTAPCIGLAAYMALSSGHADPLVVLPSDHYIAHPEVFRRDLSRAVNIARDRESIVTLGITPTRPDTGYGYIEVEGTIDSTEPFLSVKSFKEKPDIRTAETYLFSGSYLWNAGIFVATPAVILEQICRYMPEFYQGLQKIDPHMEGDALTEQLKHLYEKTPNISFDYAVMEKTEKKVFVVPSSCGWSDVGSWYSLYELKCSQENNYSDGNIAEGEALFIKASRNFVLSQTDRLVTLFGLNNTLVVDVKDVLLVADIHRHQDIKAIVEFLEKNGRKELL